MQFAEVVVNVPIRRTYSRRFNVPPPDQSGHDPSGAAPVPEDPNHDGVRLQVFHYGIPPELSSALKVGHLIWAPFGSRQVQGVVVGIVDTAPVATKLIAGLARPEPVMLPTQIDLAYWIADYYVAPISEAVKLFLPPGLLTKDSESAAVKAKRELQIELLVNEEDAAQRVEQLARDTPQIRILSWFLTHPGRSGDRNTLVEECDLKSPSAIQTLRTKNVLGGDDALGLLIDIEVAEAMVADLRGLGPYQCIVDVLVSAGRPLWKSELYQRAEAKLTLNMLRVATTDRCDFAHGANSLS